MITCGWKAKTVFLCGFLSFSEIPTLASCWFCAHSISNRSTSKGFHLVCRCCKHFMLSSSKLRCPFLLVRMVRQVHHFRSGGVWHWVAHHQQSKYREWWLAESGKSVSALLKKLAWGTKKQARAIFRAEDFWDSCAPFKMCAQPSIKICKIGKPACRAKGHARAQHGYQSKECTHRQSTARIWMRTRMAKASWKFWIALHATRCLHVGRTRGIALTHYDNFRLCRLCRIWWNISKRSLSWPHTRLLLWACPVPRYTNFAMEKSVKLHTNPPSIIKSWRRF